MIIRDTPERWQVVGSREGFSGRVIGVRVDQVMMPNGAASGVSDSITPASGGSFNSPVLPVVMSL